MKKRKSLALLLCCFIIIASATLPICLNTSKTSHSSHNALNTPSKDDKVIYKTTQNLEIKKTSPTNVGASNYYITISNEVYWILGQGDGSQSEMGGPHKIDNYTILEYLGATGTQYIDSEYAAGYYVKVEGEFVMLSDGLSDLCGSRVSDFSRMFYYGIVVTSNSYAMTSFYTTNKNYNLNFNIKDLRLKIEHGYPNSSKATCNATTSSTTFSASSFTTPSGLYIFAQTYNGTETYARGTKNLYYFKMWDNGVLVRDFVPAESPDGTLGLYDKLNKKFYTNKGTGTFVAGEKITTECEIYTPSDPAGTAIRQDSNKREFADIETVAGPKGYFLCQNSAGKYLQIAF